MKVKKIIEPPTMDEILQVIHKGVVAHFGEGDDWITLYDVKSKNENKGECQEMLILMREKYKGKKFGGTVALNPAMKHIYRKLNIEEYDNPWEIPENLTTTLTPVV